MSSSSWNLATGEDDWESCAPEMTNASTTPPPKYSSFQMTGNIETGSSSTLQQESLHNEHQIDLENGQLQSTPGSRWRAKISSPVKRLYNRIPVKKICSHVTLGNIGNCIGIAILGFFGLSAAIILGVLMWDLVVSVVVGRVRIPDGAD
ncbi:hypothetical protein VC83_01676 [Pseudogymnoascus destructans]|uniref:Uncharacterized protein n=2 Tax=Pseudogymnoascus destructans TaxID=655981 RepID=L8FVX7_PSED2|nr:uncharacterized protein VC83_01676 [Pseudogymnoascus destructans]ELR05105.1 hypothetical protein GMDG_07147 [Pseudogymnoascus destructans 20631-21]OAF62099.1 hypothetical protein VC83_01676 [Pseudogymnoascus destructans]